MARIEKYRAYREQIKNEQELKNALNEPTPLVKEFQKELDGINSKILSQYRPVDIQLLELLTIDASKRKNISAIQSFVDEFNFSELISMRERAQMFVNSQRNKFTEFEEGWLDKDVGLETIYRCNNMFNSVQSENIAFDHSSQTDFRKFKEIESIARRSRSDDPENQVLELPEPKRAKSLYIPFFVALSVFGAAILAFIAVLVVIIVK